MLPGLDKRKWYLNKIWTARVSSNAFLSCLYCQMLIQYVTTWRSNARVFDIQKSLANLKPHAYSDMKAGPFHSWRCFKMFQLYWSATHFVLCKKRCWERVHMFFNALWPKLPGPRAKPSCWKWCLIRKKWSWVGEMIMIIIIIIISLSRPSV